MEIVRSLQPLEFLDYCRAFAMCELDALAKQDRLCAIVAEYHDQLCTVNPDYRRQIEGCEYVERFLMKVAKRVADETKRKECDMAFLAKKWGTDWQEQVSCSMNQCRRVVFSVADRVADGEYELALSQCARRELRRAAKLPEGSAQLFGHFLRQQVEERRTNLAVSKMRGGSRCDAAGRADMAKALVHYRNVRQAQVATATSIGALSFPDLFPATTETKGSPGNSSRRRSSWGGI